MAKNTQTTFAANQQILLNQSDYIFGIVSRKNGNPHPQQICIKKSVLYAIGDEVLIKAISAMITDPKLAKRFDDQGIWFPNKYQIELKLLGHYGDVRVIGYLRDDSTRAKTYEFSQILMNAHSPMNQRRLK